MATTPSELKSAARSKQLVRFSRRFETGSTYGYVLDVGPTFFLLGVVSDRIWLDGFQCLRLEDVREFRADPHAEFMEAALARRGEDFPADPGVSVASVAEMVRTAGRASPLVSIHREEVDPDVCWIGRVVSVQGGRVSLRQITPAAVWEREVTTYRLAELTRLDAGGDYEEALHLVGGQPDAG